MLGKTNLSHLYPLQTDAYDNRKTKGTQTSSTRDVRYADRNGYMIRYIGYASTSYYIKHMSDILIEEMEDNGANIPSEELFYIAPSGKIYNEMLGLAMDIWQGYDDTYGYATEKIDYINGLKNIGSNFMTIYGMFDFMNQMTLKYRASDELKREIENRTN